MALGGSGLSLIPGGVLGYQLPHRQGGQCSLQLGDGTQARSGGLGSWVGHFQNPPHTFFLNIKSVSTELSKGVPQIESDQRWRDPGGFLSR